MNRLDSKPKLGSIAKDLAEKFRVRLATNYRGLLVNPRSERRVMSLGNVLATPQFRIWGIPIIFVLVGAYAKRLGRRDGDSSPWWDNWAVATSTLLMTVGTIVADIQRQGAKSNELVAWLVGVLFLVFVSVEHERFRSWRVDNRGAVIRKPIVGVLIPNLVSVVIFMAYQAAKVGP